MPTVQRHFELERWLYDAIRQYLSRSRSGVHVSDLIFPRKAYWAEILPRPATDREVGYFIAGRGHEDIVVGLSGLGRYRKLRGMWEGISHEVDALSVDDSGTETPVELKTNRRPKVPEPEEVLTEYDHAVAQLASYTASLGKRQAYLLQFHLMARGLSPDGEPADDGEWIQQSQPKLLAYQIDWTEREMDSIRDWMRLRRDMLIEAKERRDHTILPECPNWACGKEFIRKFDPRCPRCGRVYPVGEEKPDGTKTGVKKICSDCKDGRKGAELVRDQEVKFVPTCRWFAECRPTGNWPAYAGRPEIPEPAADSLLGLPTAPGGPPITAPSIDTGQDSVVDSSK